MRLRNSSLVQVAQLTMCVAGTSGIRTDCEGHSIWVDTRKIATCSCDVVWWKCTYDSEACDANDTYYTLGPSELAKDLLRDWSPPLQKPSSRVSYSFIAAVALLVVFSVLAVRAVFRRSAVQSDATDYQRLT
eukprot:Skav217653  [mRNA]  locus=scaffold2919:48826:50120:+ [translate_table: standard]